MPKVEYSKSCARVKAIIALSENPWDSTAELAQKLDCSRDAMYKNLSRLANIGIARSVIKSFKRGSRIRRWQLTAIGRQEVGPAKEWLREYENRQAGIDDVDRVLDKIAQEIKT